MSAQPPIYILTLVIGADYRRALAKCLESKRSYAERHGYTYIQGDEQWWDRERPISWCKIPFLLDVCKKVPEGALIWMSDADVLITNQALKIEDQMVALLPANKDFLMARDACGNINAGNILFRNTAWARDFWARVWEQKQFLYHIWWENAGILYLRDSVPEDAAKIEVTQQHKKFNAYLKGLPGEPLWEPGDFLVHYAGVYDLKMMGEATDQILAGGVPRLPMR